MTVKLKMPKNKPISAGKINALAAKVRKIKNKISGFKFGTDRMLGKDGKGTAKKVKSGGGEKSDIQKAYKRETYELEAAARATKKLKAEIMSLMSKSQLSDAERKRLKSLSDQMGKLGSKSAIKAYASQSGSMKRGFDPSKNVPATKDVDVKAEKKKELKEDRERVEKVREIMARDKKAKGGMTMKKKGMAKGGAMMKKKGMAKGGAMMKKKGMAMGGMKKKGMMAGGLKKPAANQTGLKKLPTSVRNKMGYMAKGGMKKKGMAMGGMKKKGYAMGGMRVKYKVGGMVKGKKYGIVDNKKKK
jgi:hypothetical protein